MSEMVERVARVIYETEPYGLPRATGEMSWADVHESQKEGFRIKARAAIEAMREPTDLMGNGLPEDYRPGSHSATRIWQAMIDAALPPTPATY